MCEDFQGSTSAPFPFREARSTAPNDWFETHIQDQLQFEAALANHRGNLINTPQITAHLNQSTLIQFCSLSAPEAARLIIYHVRNNHSGLSIAFEEYCRANSDLQAFLVYPTQGSPPGNAHLKLQPGTSTNRSLRASWANFPTMSFPNTPTSPSWLSAKRPSDDSRSSSSAEVTTVASSASPPMNPKSLHVTYSSGEEVLILTAPKSIIEGLHYHQRIEILITVKEKYLAQQGSKLSFTLTATCLICRSTPEWHAEFATDSEIQISTSSIFALSKPVNHCLTAEGTERAGSYSLLASFDVPGRVKCKCRPDSESSAERLSKGRPRYVDAMDFLLSIRGRKYSRGIAEPEKSAKAYLAQIPMSCNQGTKSRALSYILPAVIKSRPIDIKIVFSWKTQPQQESVSYLLVLKAAENYDGLAKSFKKIGRGLHVQIVWKTRIGDKSPINCAKLRSGCHKHAEILCNDISSGTCVRLEGSICLNRINKGSTASLGASWYEIHVEAGTWNQPRGILFSVPLHY